jgi:hypothetical protein
MLIYVLIFPNMQIDINIPELNPEMVSVHMVTHMYFVMSVRKHC